MKFDPRLDYESGWRWLLPLQGCRSFGLYGFDRDEEQFWKRALAPFVTLDDTGRADGLVVDADRCGQTANLDDSDLSSAHMVCVIVGKSCADRWRNLLNQTFPKVREYALLPSGKPRVVVPLGTNRHAVIALGLHRPGRWLPRLGILFARLLAAAGNFSLLGGRVLLIATRQPGAVPIGAAQAELPTRLLAQGTDYALYLGTPDDNRKTVVLLLGDSAPDIILKVAATATARTALQNEAVALAILGRSSVAHCVPKSDKMVAVGDTLTLYQEYRSRRWVCQYKMRAAVICFLAQLSHLGRRTRPLSSLLLDLPATRNEGLPGEVVAAYHALCRRLQMLAKGGAELLVYRSHGDFAPWNCSWTQQGLFVFDWEESREQDLALSDAFYYVISPAVHVQRGADATSALNIALRLAVQVAKAAELPGLEIRAYLALWLIRRVKQTRLYGEMLISLEREWR